MRANAVIRLCSLGFHQLSVQSVIGCLPFEKKGPRELRIDLKVDVVPTDMDRLEQTVDYAALAELCQRVSIERPRELLETLAADILNEVMAVYSITKARIRIEKPDCIEGASYAFVEMETE